MKTLNKLIRGWEDQGIRVERTNNGHLKLFCPNGAIVHVSGTPSDHRAMRNAQADIRRALRSPTPVETQAKLDHKRPLGKFRR